MNNRGEVNIGKLVIIFVLFIVVASMFVTAGVFFFSYKFFKEGTAIDESQYDVSVDATVIDHEIGSYSDDDGFSYDTYRPVYQYEYNGQTYVANGSIGSTNKPYNEGDSVSVMISSKDPSMMYDPNFNSETEFNSFRKESVKAFGRAGIIGALMFAGVIGYTIHTVKKQKSGMENQLNQVHNYDQYIQDRDNNPYI